MKEFTKLIINEKTLKMKLCFYIIILISESYEINSTIYLTIKGTETQTILDYDFFDSNGDKIESIYVNGNNISSINRYVSGLTQQINNITIIFNRQLTNLKFMFYGCSALVSLDLSHFNTSNVQSMSYMFLVVHLLGSWGRFF